MDDRTKRDIQADCTALVNAFTYHIDHREYDRLAALFLADGAWERHGERLEGRDAIMAAMNKRPPNQFTRHCTMTVHFLEIGETTARAKVYNLSFFSMDPPAKPNVYLYRPENMLFVDMDDTYRKTADGWRIAERHSPFIFLPDSVLNH